MNDLSDHQAAYVWAQAGHSERQIAKWLCCSVGRVRAAAGNRGNPAACPPTPPEIKQRVAVIRAGWSEAETLRRQGWEPPGRVETQVVLREEIG